MIFGIKTNQRMHCWQWLSVAMETYFHVFPLKQQYFKNFLREHWLKSILLELSHDMIYKSVACLAVAKEGNYVWMPCHTP